MRRTIVLLVLLVFMISSYFLAVPAAAIIGNALILAAEIFLVLTAYKMTKERISNANRL